MGLVHIHADLVTFIVDDQLDIAVLVLHLVGRSGHGHIRRGRTGLRADTQPVQVSRDIDLPGGARLDLQRLRTTLARERKIGGIDADAGDRRFAGSQRGSNDCKRKQKVILHVFKILKHLQK